MSTRIVLDKRTKTIKVVNRRSNIRLVHSGKVGPTGVSTFVRAHHHADANYARPNAVFVEWLGSVAPLNATTEDTWIQTPAD
jgi:hypothetical protein